MKLYILFLLVAVCSMVNTAVGGEDSVNLTNEEKANLKSIIEGTNKFAFALYKEMVKSIRGNVIVSPLSAQMILALAYTGAEGDTASELKSLLSLPDSLNQTYSGYHSLIKSLEDPALKLVDRMFVERTAGVKKDFQYNAQKYFHAPAETEDFQTAPEQSRQHINLWVENQTNKKIKNFFQQGSISKLTKLVLVNAIHFQANWTNQFDQSETKEQPFHVSQTETTPVQMMHTKTVFGFSKSAQLKSKILELKYRQRGKNYRMIIILPDEIDGLAELEANLGKVDLFNELKGLELPMVTAALPKFKLEQTIDLKNILVSLGVKTMFDEKAADFSKLSNEKVSVSTVFQKAFVDVNEEGTEAAAATGTGNGSAPPVADKNEQFLADHPFLFLIANDDFPIFIGRVVRPN